MLKHALYDIDRQIDLNVELQQKYVSFNSQLNKREMNKVKICSGVQ